MRHLRNPQLFATMTFFAALMCFLVLTPLPLHALRSVMRWAVLGGSVWSIMAAASQSKLLLVLIYLAVGIALNPFTDVVHDPVWRYRVIVASGVILMLASAWLKPDRIGADEQAGTVTDVAPGS